MRAYTIILLVATMCYTQDVFADNTADTQELLHDDLLEGDVSSAQTAGRFVDHINYARVAIALHNYSDAHAHIVEAKAILAHLKIASLEHNKKVHMESGRVIYDYDTNQQVHYFSMNSEPVEITKMTKGPVWAKVNSLAVTDAEIAYVTLDVSGNTAEKGLAKADKALEQAYYSDADKLLATLIQKVVKVDTQQHLPQQVAHDNIVLAQDFLSLNNYTGADFALKHADIALDEAKQSDGSDAGQHAIQVMRQHVQLLKDKIVVAMHPI